MKIRFFLPDDDDDDDDDKITSVSPSVPLSSPLSLSFCLSQFSFFEFFPLSQFILIRLPVSSSWEGNRKRGGDRHGPTGEQNQMDCWWRCGARAKGQDRRSDEGKA
jgi:hypothetical protein